MRVHRSSHLGRNQYREGGESQGDRTLQCGELKRLPKCEELTTSSFRGQTRETQGNVKRNRRGRRGGVLRTRLLPLQAQGNEELVRLQVDRDTGNLRLLDILLNLDLFLSLAVDRWTACVTH